MMLLRRASQLLPPPDRESGCSHCSCAARWGLRSVRNGTGQGRTGAEIIVGWIVRLAVPPPSHDRLAGDGLISETCQSASNSAAPNDHTEAGPAIVNFPLYHKLQP